MRVNFVIDWLNYTCQPTLIRRYHKLAKGYPIGVSRSVKAVHGYTDAIENMAGARTMWHRTREDMQAHVMYSGATLNKYAQAGVNAQAIMLHHATQGDVCKRLDMALDCIDSDLSIVALGKQMANKAIKRKVKRYQLMTGDTGVTLYIGSRTSERYLRIYDKGAERGTDDNWIRIELELKGSRAIQVARLAVHGTMLDLADRARGMINHMVRFDDDVWRSVMGDAVIGMAQAQDNEPDTLKWLLTQCAPAMARYINRTGDDTVLNKFITIVRSLLDDSDKAHGDRD